MRWVAPAAVMAVALAGCGGGDERQDADEPDRAFRVSVVSAKFPERQSLAGRATMSIKVRNDDTAAVPNVAVTLKAAGSGGEPTSQPGAFSLPVDDPTLADKNRPVWIVDSGPRGGDTAYTNTWALGRLAPGQSKTFQWRVTAVKAGRYSIGYEISPGLDGKAKLARSGPDTSGTFRVNVSDEPPDSRIDEDGNVVVRSSSSDG